MNHFSRLSEKHKELTKIARKAEQLENAKTLFLEIHAQLNSSAVSGTAENEYDELIKGLPESAYSVMPTEKDETIAWVLWHLARIDDLTIGMLAARGEQLFNDEWMHRMNVKVKDTANAMTDDEIMEFSKSVNVKELLAYRDAVAARTREIVSSLEASDMKRKIAKEDIERVRACGGVTEQGESVWLLDYWGGKDVAGLLLMPPTRHTMGHLNCCFKWKERILAGKKLYRGTL